MAAAMAHHIALSYLISAKENNYIWFEIVLFENNFKYFHFYKDNSWFFVQIFLSLKASVFLIQNIMSMPIEIWKIINFGRKPID